MPQETVNTSIIVYNKHGKTIRRSRNLRGILAHYRANPADVVIKVKCVPTQPFLYYVTFFWPNGDEASTVWQDWRVLLHWLKARRSWSIRRVTFDAPLYDACDQSALTEFRKSNISLTRHAYQS